jgi:hypothetical protein
MEDRKGKGQQDALRAITSPPSTYIGWQTAKARIVTVDEARRYFATSIIERCKGTPTYRSSVFTFIHYSIIVEYSFISIIYDNIANKLSEHNAEINNKMAASRNDS